MVRANPRAEVSGSRMVLPETSAEEVVSLLNVTDTNKEVVVDLVSALNNASSQEGAPGVLLCALGVLCATGGILDVSAEFSVVFRAFRARDAVKVRSSFTRLT